MIYSHIFVIITIAPPIAVTVTANLSTLLVVGQTNNTLTCGVSGAERLSPTITYQWTRHNGTTQTQVGTNSETLPLSPLRLSDAGNYSCSITSILLNNPVTANNSLSVSIQSKHSYEVRVPIFTFYSIPTVPDPHSVTTTSSSGAMVLNGSNVTLNCSIQMNQNVLASDLSLLIVNASLTRPDGAILDLSNPIIEGTSFTYTSQVISFDDSDVGTYTCNATVKPRSSSPFLTGIGELVSNSIEIVISK